MECRPLDITLISAEGIKDVNNFTTMDVYTVVSIGGDHRTKQRSPADKHGGTTPKWNYPIKLTLDQHSITQCSLQFELKSNRALGDKDIGDVSIPIRELLDHVAAAIDAGDEDAGGAGAGERVVTYPVRLPSGKQKGTLKFSYKFGQKFSHAVPEIPVEKIVQPQTAYPPPPPVNTVSGPSYPPTGYPMPVQQSYPPGGGYAYSGYPPYPGQAYPPVGYGYPPALAIQQGYMLQAPEQHKKKKGSKLGLGIGAGLLGGLLVGDMIGDVAEMNAYEAGYDDAMGDF